MKQIRLNNIKDTFFEKAWELYEDAFPLNERRLIHDQTHIMKKPNYHFDIVIDKNEFIGFLLWWDLESYSYIDHFATVSKLRNKGFGKSILDKFKTVSNKPILLEVELPNCEMNQHRIKFYERIGFKLNQHHYEIPPFEKDQEPLQLLLMSYPNYLTEKDVSEFKKKCHPIVFDDAYSAD